MKKTTKKNMGLVIGCVIVAAVIALVAAGMILGWFESEPAPTTAPTTQGTQPTQTNPTTPTDPKPTDPKPTEPKPTEPKPTDPPAPPHVHEYTEEVTPPTCVDEGFTTYTCSCGDTYTGSPVAALGHTYTEAVTPPTCTEPGFTTYTCSCGDTKTGDEVPAAGHAWSAWEVTLEPTEDAEGKRVRSCANCDAMEEGAIPQLDPSHTHSYNKEVTEPTCVSGGYTVYTCSCGDTYRDDEIPALGHSFGEWITVKEPTEEAEGKAERTCSACDAKEEKTLPKLDHVHDYIGQATEPTCTEGGYTTFTCACGDSYRANEVPALGHAYGEWAEDTAPTCDEDGSKCRTCSRCGESQQEAVPATGHNYGDWQVTKEATCTEAGEKTRVCANCNDTQAQPLEKIPHSYTTRVVPATCEDGGYTIHTCSCGDSYTDSETAALGHSFGDWITVKEPTEEAEGEEQRTCSACGKAESRAIPKLNHHHAYTSKIVAPTCTEKGYTEFTCVCGDSYKEDYTDALGHGYVKTVVEPTCTDKGYTTHTCSVCGDTYTDSETAAKGHMWTTWVEVQHPTCLMIGIEERTCPACDSVESRDIDALSGMKDVTYATITYENSMNVRSGPSTDYAKLGTLASGSRVEVYQISKIGSQTWASIKYLDYSSAWIRVDGYAEIEEVKEPMGHAWGDWETTQPATCQAEGKQERACAHCSETQKRSTDKADHTWGAWETLEGSSCTGGITKERTCSICGAKEKDVTAAAHAYTHWTVHEEATCYKDGSRSRSCVNCGEVEEEVLKSSGHYYANGWETTKRATATEEGEAQRICTICGHSEIFVIPVGHTRHDYDKTVVDATCTEQGYTLYSCKTCGLVNKRYTDDAAGHTWSEWETTLEPQIGKVGYEQRTCTTCGETMAVAIPPLDEDGNPYVPYVDPKVEVSDNHFNVGYHYYIVDGGTNVTCVDFRSWGAGPSVWINDDGTMTVVYYNMAGERIEVMVYLPQDGYVRRLAIQEDGTYEIAQIGGYG